MKPMMLFLAAIGLASSALAGPSLPCNVPSYLVNSHKTLSNYDSETQLEFTNVQLNWVIDIPFLLVPGKDLLVYRSHGGENQLFKLVKDSYNSFRIINPYSGLYLQSLSSSTLVHLGNESTHRRSLWIFQEAGKNTYTIQNEDNKLYMEPMQDRYGGDTYVLSLKQRNETCSQLWMLKFATRMPIPRIG